VDYARGEREELGAVGLRIREVEVEAETTHGDMTLYLTEWEEGIDVNLQYNRQLYLEETIESLVNKYDAVLAYVEENESIRVSEIVSRLEKERRQKRRRRQEQLKQTNVSHLKQTRRNPITY
jgi:hypothetical protein